jgi:MFS family permease
MKHRLFFGWYVLTGSFAVLFFVQGARAVFGLLFKPIIADLGWSRSDVSAVVFLNMTVFALTLTGVGRLFDRYGARRVVLIATVFLAAGHIGIALVGSLWQFFLIYGVIAAIGFGGTSIPLFAALATKWFHRHRGVAISLTVAGGCLGQYLLVPVVTWLLNVVGWRWVLVLIGLAILVVNVIVTLWTIRDDPAAMGLSPLGAQTSETFSGSISLGRQDCTLREAMRTAPFWLYMVVMFVCGGGDYLVLLHLVPMVTDHAIAAETAAGMLAWFGLFSLIGVLITGRAIDHFGDKTPLVITFILRGLLFLMILQYQTTAAFYIFALGFGFTMLVTAPITTTLMGRLFGLTHLGLITGVITTVHHLSGGLWVYLGGLFFDLKGDYRYILSLYGIACFVAVLCALLIREKPHDIQTKY